jgi:hypothetical protein
MCMDGSIGSFCDEVQVETRHMHARLVVLYAKRGGVEKRDGAQYNVGRRWAAIAGV